MKSPFIAGYATATFVDNAALQKLVDEAVQERLVREEQEIKRMLGMWVSGLEPCIFRGPGGILYGLGQAGLPLGAPLQIIIWAWSDAC